jgi:NTE family protein
MFCLCLMMPAKLLSQEQANEQHKIGLVLSGGGARGMAHIGVLQVLEEIGIYPDYITGTSMGSVVGGLYALGYSADELDSITRTADWSVILGNDIDFKNVAYEEKEYFGRYLLELPMNGLTPSLPKGLLEGQNLNTLFSDLTRSAHDVTDFDDLPIPYRAIATDIETGQSVTLKGGSLNRSMRASMAIPSVFTPVVIDDKLLVDGGLVRNFPVTEAKEMGADIIIGVFVSTDLESKEGLNSLVDILFQSSFVMSAYDSREQTELVDYYVEPALKGYSSRGFDQSDSIINRGYRSALLLKEQFQQLYDSLTSLGKTFNKPQKLSNPRSYKLRNITVSGNVKQSDEFVIGRLPIKEGVETTIEDIDKAVEKMYGTRFFQKITYSLHKLDSGEYDLLFSVEERKDAQLKFAVHYNNETRAGLNLNYTVRNKFLRNSRLVAEIDLAELFRGDFSYLKYLGKRQISALTVAYHFNNTELPAFSNGQQFSNFKFDRHNAWLRLQSTNRPDMSFGVEYHWNFSYLRPIITETFDFIDRTRIQTNTVRAFYEYNTLNRPFIPTRGIDIRTEIGVTLLNSTETEFNENSTPEQEEIINEAFNSEDFAYARINGIALAPLNSRVSLIGELDLMYTSVDKTGLNYEIGIGGFYDNLDNTSTFHGAKFFEYTSNNFLKLVFGLQYQVGSNVYIKGQANWLDGRYPLAWFGDTGRPIDNFDGSPTLFGYGLGLAFNSILGPIEFNLGTTNKIDQLRFGLNIGYWY